MICHPVSIWIQYSIIPGKVHLFSHKGSTMEKKAAGIIPLPFYVVWFYTELSVLLHNFYIVSGSPEVIARFLECIEEPVQAFRVADPEPQTLQVRVVPSPSIL